MFDSIYGKIAIGMLLCFGALASGAWAREENDLIGTPFEKDPLVLTKPLEVSAYFEQQGNRKKAAKYLFEAYRHARIADKQSDVEELAKQLSSKFPESEAAGSLLRWKASDSGITSDKAATIALYE